MHSSGYNFFGDIKQKFLLYKTLVILDNRSNLLFVHAVPNMAMHVAEKTSYLLLMYNMQPLLLE